MNKQFTAALNKTIDFSHNVTSKNGVPIYDLMIPVRRSDGHGGYLDHYMGASGTVFYTEDETLLKAFQAVRHDGSLDEVKAFVKAHPEAVMSDLKIPQMGHPADKAYWHLAGHEVRTKTMDKKNYGCAYLVQEEKVLVFHQLKAGQIYQEKNLDLNDKAQFKHASLKLLEMYQNGKIEPDGEITDGAFIKLKKYLRDYVVVPEIENNHELKKEIQTFIGFINNFQVKMDIDYDNIKEVKITLDERAHYNITKSSKAGFIKVDDKAVSMNDFLKTLYVESTTLDNKIDSFLGKKNKP